MGYGIWRVAPRPYEYLRRRLSRKPQTTTAPDTTPDVVTSMVLLDDGFRYIIRLTNISGGQGENGKVKVNLSGIVGRYGHIKSGLNIDRIQGNVAGFTSVTFYWDANTDSQIPPLGPGKHDHNYLKESGPLIDPQETGYSGDILLTTTGNQIGDSYTLTLWTTVRYLE